jgi:hypothetical protein
MSAPKFFRPTQGDEILPLNFDPKFWDHPFDRRIATKISELLDIANHPAYAKDTLATIAGPKSNSDEDLLEYWKEHIFFRLAYEWDREDGQSWRPKRSG